MVDSVGGKMGVMEYVAKRGHTGTDPVDIWFGGRHAAVELYVKSSAAANMHMRMIPVSIEGVSFHSGSTLTGALSLLNPPTATNVVHAAADESVVFYQGSMSGVRVHFASNVGSVDIVVRLVGRNT
tara:strand:+ start:320 stop:697 length:378 start_codon:yes stop_codon:yes gene_type:complete